MPPAYMQNSYGFQILNSIFCSYYIIKVIVDDTCGMPMFKNMYIFIFHIGYSFCICVLYVHIVRIKNTQGSHFFKQILTGTFFTKILQIYFFFLLERYCIYATYIS